MRRYINGETLNDKVFTFVQTTAMQFKTVAIVKHPLETVWDVMQNKLPEIAEWVDDIEEIKACERGLSDSGDEIVIHEWKAAPPLPDFVKSWVQPDMLTWTDSAVWKQESKSCHWVIESHYFRDKMSCSGITSYQPALGGKGCRLNFEGTLKWNPGAGVAGAVVLQGMETILSALIPSNFRKLAAAVEQYTG